MKKIITTFCFIATLAMVGCGGGDSSSSPVSPQPVKAYRDPLIAENVNVFYSASSSKSPIVNNVMGTLAFSLGEGEPLDVVSVDKLTGILTFLNPGDVRIQVVDTSSVYETSTAMFSVHIEKGTNYSFSAATKIISTIEKTPQYIVAREAKGKVTYEVATNYTDIVAVDTNSGKLTPLGRSGRATIHIFDSGNRQYEPATKDVDVIVKAVKPETLTYAPITHEFAEGLTLDPQQLSGGDQGTFRYSLVDDVQNYGVVSINERTGQLTVHKAGQIKIQVMNVLDDNFTEEQREAYFDVTIGVAKRTQEIQVSNANYTYSPHKKIVPVVNYTKGNLTYTVDESDNDVIDIDPQTKLPRIVGVGSASLRVTDDGNGNYQSSETRFTYSVTKAEHPGLANKAIELTYSANPQQNKVTPKISGQIGTLTFEGNRDVVSYTSGQLTVHQVGDVVLTMTDSGGDNYLPTSAKLTVSISKGTQPNFTVGSISQVYKSGLCIELDNNLIFDNSGDLSISIHAGANLDVATYDQVNNCITVLKDGITYFDVVSGETHNYKASESKLLDVTITKANSTLAVADSIRAIYSPRGTPKSPVVTGGTENLTYSFRSGSPTDVVDVDPSTGALKIKNAGVTTVMVTDAGGDGFQPAIASFSVRIDRAENPVAVTYKETIYDPSQQLVPSVVGAVSSVEFNLYDESHAPVKLLDVLTGKLEIKTAGTYELLVIAHKTRNYSEKRFTVNGVVKKAPHPGLANTSMVVEYAPLKKVVLQSKLPIAKGTRSYSIGDKVTKAYVEVDPNTGELTLLNYESLLKTTAIILVSEAESENYLAMSPKTLTKLNVTIEPPKSKHSDLDVTLARTMTVLDSYLNNNGNFANLKETAIHFAGVGNVLMLTDDEMKEYGPGVKFILNMQKNGETDIRKRKAVMVYALRYDGCASEVNISALPMLFASQQSLAIDAPGFCSNGTTNRYLKFLAIDDTLTAGNWQLTSPFVVYRRSDRLFTPSSWGGGYSGVIGGTPSKLLEWNRVEFNISK